VANNFDILDAVGATKTIATKDVGGVHYQNIAPTISTSGFVTAASTNATVVKASPGTLKSVYIANVAGTPRYVKFHDTASTPTAGSGVVYRVMAQAGVVTNVVLPGDGRAFATGIALTVVTGITDADAVAVGAGDAIVEIAYE
jgi:hypothetical protein